MAVPACGVKQVAALRLRRRRENETASCRAMPILMSVLALLPVCAPMSSLSPGDRAQLCRIEVDARLPQPVFVANPLSTESGAVTGAGAGAVQGLLTGPAAIVAVPFYLIFGAGVGAACAEGASRYPSANADYQRILGAANIGVLKQAVELELAAARAECRQATVAPCQARASMRWSRSRRLNRAWLACPVTPGRCVYRSREDGQLE